MTKKFYTSIEKRGSDIYQRFIENGKPGKEIIPFSPELYVRSNKPKDDAFDMKGNVLSKMTFSSIRESHDFVERYKGVDGYKIYGAIDPIVQFVAREYPDNIEFNASLIKGAIVDIEVASGQLIDGKYEPGPFPEPEHAAYPISMLTIFDTKAKVFYVWATEWFQGKHLGTYKHDTSHPELGGIKVVYQGFENEVEMLANMMLYWQAQEFDFVSGWYYEEFDTPYLVNRVRKVLGEEFTNKFSPWSRIKARIIKQIEREIPTYDFAGVACLDLLNLYKKHAGIEPPNWKLDTIAELQGVGSKVSYQEEGDIGSMYILNFQKSVEYNIMDVELVRRLEAKAQLFMLTFTLAYLTKSNYRDTLATVRPWTSLMYSKLHSRGIETEIKSVYQGTIDIVGGFVREVIPGKYKWVVSFDLNSLYPHIMQQYNLGVETILDPMEVPREVTDAIPFDISVDKFVEKKYDLSILKKYNLSMTANRQFFKNDQLSVFSEVTREIYNNRASVKKAMKKLEQELVHINKEIESRK